MYLFSLGMNSCLKSVASFFILNGARCGLVTSHLLLFSCQNPRIRDGIVFYAVILKLCHCQKRGTVEITRGPRSGVYSFLTIVDFTEQILLNSFFFTPLFTVVVLQYHTIRCVLWVNKSDTPCGLAHSGTFCTEKHFHI